MTVDRDAARTAVKKLLHKKGVAISDAEAGAVVDAVGSAHQGIVGWSEGLPGVGMMKYRGRTVVVMEQDAYRRISEATGGS